MSYARILIDRTESTTLDYAIPESLRASVHVGSRVCVPLRRTETKGIVLSLHESSTFKQVKFIISVINHEDTSSSIAEKKEPHKKALLSPLMMELAHWMADYYCTSLDSVLRSLLPVSIRNNSMTEKKIRYIQLLKKPEDSFLKQLSQRAPKQKAILEFLLRTNEKISVSDLFKKTKSSPSSLDTLVKEGWISINKEVLKRDPFAGQEFLPSIPPKLNSDQEKVVTLLQEELELLYESAEKKRKSLPFLLHGVTGSGKTEVYLRVMEKALTLGKSVLILVPEIALTPQTVERFRARLECTQEKRLIAVLHSHLSEGERHDEWLRIYHSEARIVIGARSAIFAPLQNLGLIIVDEEHETSYKQEETPRYHARDIAVMRALYENALLLLGSATPSLESMQNVHAKKYRLLEMPKRADHQKMPLVRILDMRLQGKQKGADSVLSLPLRRAMMLRLERSEQIILFLNRRGFSSALVCQHCGAACSCPNCSLSLTFHRVTEQLICHLCGFQQKPPKHCPDCHEEEILYSGIGTQRVEAAVKKLFPEARSFRIDADTMQRKGSYQETFDRFRKHQIDILIGTQMIAKGLDFPNVTLVGIINADTSLYAPDFRAGERTFQLLTQVAGRSGRGEREGEVMIQTFTPESPSIQFARHHDYHGFFDQEVEFRKQFGYPPFQKMILIQLRGIDQKLVKAESMKLRKELHNLLPPSIFLGEAVPAPLERAHGQYRFHIAMRGSAMKETKTILRSVISKRKLPHGVILTIDVDPQSLL